jgi:hypothetical protein
MFSARSAAIAADYPRPGPATGKNAAVGAFIQYAAFKAHDTCAAFRAHDTCAAFRADDTCAALPAARG